MSSLPQGCPWWQHKKISQTVFRNINMAMQPISPQLNSFREGFSSVTYLHPLFVALQCLYIRMFVLNSSLLPLTLKYFRWLAIACSADSSGQILTPVEKKTDLFLRNKWCRIFSDSLKSRCRLKSSDWKALVKCQLSGRSCVGCLAGTLSVGEWISSAKEHCKLISLSNCTILYYHSTTDFRK